MCDDNDLGIDAEAENNLLDDIIDDDEYIEIDVLLLDEGEQI